MDRSTYCLLENYMLSCMGDSAHDKEHVYRVLYNAMEIAKYEQNVDYDVLICACLLHDIGRKEQLEHPEVCHAKVGSEKAYSFLITKGFGDSFAGKVAHCILCHRYRTENVPQTIEAKILFDADKLDATGAIGIARTLIYGGMVDEPLYNTDAEGSVIAGERDTGYSFFREYKNKLEKLYDRFYTNTGAEMAKQRQGTAVSFYEKLVSAIRDSYEVGKDEIDKHIS